MAVDPLTSRTADELLHAAFDTDDEDLAERPVSNVERDDKAILSSRKRKAEDDLENPTVEEEVKITKQRKKIPKLDTDKLLSEPGLPTIRNLLRSGRLKKKLRLKGKGHEFSDAARLLNYYQMWLDNLYPRARFADAIQLVEKAGHTKKMQMYRKSWIDEGKPGYMRREEMDTAFDIHNDGAREQPQGQDTHTNHLSKASLEEDPASMFFGDDEEDDSRDDDHNGPDDDELEALLAHESVQPPTVNRKSMGVDSEGEDDLDALLAQADTFQKFDRAEITRHKDGLSRDNHSRNDEEVDEAHHETLGKRLEPENEEVDELDVLLNEGADPSKRHIEPLNGVEANEVSGDDMDDLDALLNNTIAVAEPELPRNRIAAAMTGVQTEGVPSSEEVPELDNVVSSSPIPNIRTDELDQLLDEHDAAIEQQKKGADPEIVEEFMSSSPILNEPE